MTSLFRPSWSNKEERKKSILDSIKTQDVPVSELFPYIASYFANDKEVIKKLIAKNPLGIGCASKELQDDEELAVACLRFSNHKKFKKDIYEDPSRITYYESQYLNREPLSVDSLKYISKRLKSSKAFLKKVIPLLPVMVMKDPVVSETVAGNKALIFQALEGGVSSAFGLLSGEQRNDKNIVSDAVALIPSLLTDVANKWLHDRDIVKHILDLVWPDDLALIIEPSMDDEACAVLSDVLLLSNPDSLNSFAHRAIGVDTFNKIIQGIRTAINNHTDNELLEVFHIFDPSANKSDYLTDILLTKISNETLASFPVEGKWYEQKVKNYLFKESVKKVEFTGSIPDKKARKISKPF